MGDLTPLVALASGSLSSWIQLLIALALVALNYWATARIIAQAGYSRTWILLPLAPLILTVICFFILWHDLNAFIFGGSIGFLGIDSVGFWWHLDQVSIFLCWLAFIVFAFSRWPASNGWRSTDGATPPLPQSTGAETVGATAAAPQPASAPVTRARPASAAGPGAGPAVASSAPVKKTGAQFCVWCGEATPGNRALFHDCGPKDRPETFCKNCGTALPAESAACTACAG